MASVEELCEMITSQLKEFDHRNATLRQKLQRENNAMRAALAHLGQTSTLNSCTLRDAGRETSEGNFMPTATSLISDRQDSDLPVSPVHFRNIDASYLFQNDGDSDDKPYGGIALHEGISSTESCQSLVFSFRDSSDTLEGAWANWYKILSPILNMSLLGLNRSKLESTLLLRSAWEASQDKPMGRRPSVWTRLTSKDRSAATADESSGIVSLKTSSWSKYMLHPDSKVVTTWCLLGALMIFYDVITFPVAGFDLEETDFAVIVMWITTLFWTSDMMLTFLRGVHYKGIIEMRPSRICWLYARSWLAIDFIMVTVDWFVLYMTSGGDTSIAGASKVLRSGKALRAARVVRAIRLIRTIKVLQYLRDMFENIKSEYIQLMIKLFASVAAILISSHYVTCSWFAQAHFNSNEPTWITVYLGRNPRPSFLEEYVTSMHFSLTQLAGSQNIVPQNGQERFVASLIIVFDIVIFSTLVGIITDIMAQFRSLTFDRSREVSLIRKFFARSELPAKLENRIWVFFRKHYRSKTHSVNECEIEFFRYLPSSLKMDLHEHLYVPVLSEHPLFKRILQYDQYSLLAVCGTAVTTNTSTPGSEIFAEGDIAKSAFFLTAGVFRYQATQYGIESTVDSGEWVAEAALWTKWMHCGRLTTQTTSQLLKVDADMFEKTLYERAETSDWFRGLRKYAALFAQRVSDSFDTEMPIADVDRNVDCVLERIVKMSFNFVGDLGSGDTLGEEPVSKPRKEDDRASFTRIAAKMKKGMSFVTSSLSSGLPFSVQSATSVEFETAEEASETGDNNGQMKVEEAPAEACTCRQRQRVLLLL